MKIKAVLFDLGDTLWSVDYSAEAEAYDHVRQALIEALGERVPDAQALRDAAAAVFVEEAQAWQAGKMEQLPAEEAFRRAFARLGLDVPEETLRRMPDLAVSGSIRYRVDPETRRTLRALRERGFRIGVISNTYQSRASLERSLADHGLLPLIDVLVISSEVGLTKPHPAIFEAALNALRVSPAEAVFIGDTPLADIKGAKNLGMRAVLTHQFRQADPGEYQPDLIIKRPGEIIDYVDRQERDGP
ncbi:MAG: HAD family hydrolase [Dehalococcoidia bacterium]|nr:HAD family hydrolase [Dehalococcoidia bacterium]